MCTVSVFVWGQAECEILEQEFLRICRYFFFFCSLQTASEHRILMKLRTNLSRLVQKLRDNKAAGITEGPG